MVLGLVRLSPHHEFHIVLGDQRCRTQYCGGRWRPSHFFGEEETIGVQLHFPLQTCVVGGAKS